jgi:hypothetical protein
LGLLLALSLIGVTAVAQTVPPQTLTKKRIVIQNIDKCQEDNSILVGRGDWNGVKWDKYVCRSMEDFNRKAFTSIQEFGPAADSAWHNYCVQYRKRFTSRGFHCDPPKASGSVSVTIHPGQD